MVNAFAKARISPARRAGSPAFAAAEAYDLKLDKYESLLTDARSTVRFVPIAVTANGAYDARSLRWLQGFSRVCAAAEGTPASLAFATLMQRLSVALWRANSRLLRACAEPTADRGH